MTPPKDRDALIEVMASGLFGNRVLAEATLLLMEQNGVFVGPVAATYGLDKMSGAGAEAIPAAEGVSGYAGQIACRVWTAMQSANPYKKDPSQ